MIVGGCCSAMAERWWLKPESLGSTPGGSTFLSLLLFRRSWNSNDQDDLLFDDLYRSAGLGKPLNWAPRAVILLRFFWIYNTDTQQLSPTYRVWLAIQLQNVKYYREMGVEVRHCLHKGIACSRLLNLSSLGLKALLYPALHFLI